MKPLAWTLLAGALVAGSLSLSAQQAAPDLILSNGKIITVDESFSIAQAVAVRGDRIVAVGTNQEINRLAGPNTRRIDLRGKSVIPGFIDDHAHFQEEGEYWTLELRLDGVESRKQALEMIRAKARLNLPLVCVAGKEKPLSAVLNDLTTVYGLNIVVEPNARTAMKTPLTERLLNVPADTALELLAGQADLKVVRKGNTFRITSNGPGAQ